ncbi:YihY/virulence factor BrkB family protein [Falsibacillus albus]|uniref:YihY/virulence factor BrkB family protein n=1 Tax=Falsibacillus albus TaxID=2478915 RepID=A0A3L7JUU1_9BACI|nr:YihY/virulence factor BrkB family protein [Falsibacillus albus]RLQ94496.1 YihY/virulence factor BrkB family protein [Falsibacillus albus]
MREKKISKSFIKNLASSIQYDDAVGLAAELSYFFLLSMFPLLIFLVTLLPYLPFTEEDVLNVIRDFAPGQTMDLIQTNLKEIMSNRSNGLLSFGIIATIWSASNGMNAIVKALNRAYRIDETRSFLVTRGMSIFLTFGMIFVFMVALLLPVFGKQIGMYLFSKFGFSELFLQLWNALRWIVSAIILFLIFVGIYYFAPSKKISCVTAFPGAIVATIGWVIASFAFSFYVSSFGNYSSTYGSIGGIIVLMLWLFISGFIIILGGEVNALLNVDDEECKS